MNAEKLTTQSQWDAQIKGNFEIHFKNRKTKKIEITDVREGSYFLSKLPANVSLQDIVTMKLRTLNGWRPNLWCVEGIYKV